MAEALDDLRDLRRDGLGRIAVRGSVHAHDIRAMHLLQPVRRRRQAGHRGERDDAVLAVEGDILHARRDAQATARVDVFEVFHHLVFIGADDYLAIAVGKEGVADAAEIDRVDDLYQGIEGDVTAYHADQLAIGLAFHRGGNGHHQAADGALVGRGQHGLPGARRGAVPRALAGVVTGGHLRVGALGECAVGLAQVGEQEIARVRRLLDKPGQGVTGTEQGDVLGQVLQHQDAPAHPVLHAAGGQCTGLLHRRFDVLADGVALQVVVVEREQGKSQDHDAAGAEQDLVAKFQVHVSRP